MKTVKEFYDLASLNGCALVYELSGCEIDSCYSNLNFRYCVCLGKRAPSYPDNYRLYIHSKACMWHNKNTQLKDFLPLYSVYQIFSFTAGLTHLRFSMVKQLQSRLARNWSKRLLFISKRFASFSRYLFGS